MKKYLALLALGAFVVGAPALAADTKTTDAKPNAQQDKMTACNAQAGDKKGDDRKAFMKTCLSAKPAEPAKPESKMAMCNKKTAGLKGEERNKAQSECMKGS
jgi:psiF repeat